MEKFAYKVKTKDDQTIKGIVEAKDIRQGAKILQDKGFLVISLIPQGVSLSSSIRGRFSNRANSNDKVNFTRQLSTMIAAGLRVTEALEILESQSSPAMSRVVSDILRDIESGSNFTAALEKHPDIFDQVYLALIRAGEAAGVLDKVLARLADNLEKQKDFKGKIKGAMIYPIIVVSAMILVAGVMIVFVIPKMMSIYDEFQAELPLPTKILLQISNLASHFWWLGVIIIIGLIFVWRTLSAKPAFKKQFDKFFFAIPIIGKLRKQIMLTEFIRTLGLLVGSGVLIVEALEIVRYSLVSPIYQEAISTVIKEVQRGFPFAAALANTQVFPPIISQMVGVGEETGKMDEVLMKIASYFEQEADAAVKGLTTAIEPLIMIVLGIGVGFLVIAVIMPIYNLTSQF